MHTRALSGLVIILLPFVALAPHRAAAQLPSASVATDYGRLRLSMTAFPNGARPRHFYVLHSATDVNKNGILLGVGNVYRLDHFQGGMMQSVLLPSPRGTHRVLGDEADVFRSDLMAMWTYQWLSVIGGWQSIPGITHVVGVKSAWPWTSGISYVYQGTRYTFEWCVSGAVLLTAMERDTPNIPTAVTVAQRTIVRVGLPFLSHIAHLRARGLFRSVSDETASVDGSATTWSLTLEYSKTSTKIDTTTTQGRFAVFVLHATNIGTNAAAPDTDLTFTATDDKGRNYTVDTNVSDSALAYQFDGFTSPGVDDVQPTFSTEFVVVFEVAKDAKDVTLRGSGGFSTDSPQTLFHLWH